MHTLTTSLAFLAFAACQPDTNKNDPKKPGITIGKETTFALGPIDKDGYVDYRAALNERVGKGFVPSKNAQSLLMLAIGPELEGKPLPAEYWRLLGVKEPAKDGDYFRPLHAYLKDSAKLDFAAANEVLDKQRQAACARRWSSKEFPHLAGWLKANEGPLRVALEASRRPAYFNPMIADADTDRPPLLGASLTSATRVKEMVLALSVRALWRESPVRDEDAWQDLLAAHRLSRLAARGATLIEMLIGVSSDQAALNADIGFLAEAKLSPKQWQQCLRDLQSLPPLPPFADAIDLGERFFFLDAITHIRRGGIKELKKVVGEVPWNFPEPVAQKAFEAIEWDAVLREGNRWYDRLSAAMRLPDRPERVQSLNKLRDDVAAMRASITPENFLKDFLADKNLGKTIGNTMGKLLVSMNMVALGRVSSFADESEQRQRNLHVAFALAAYRAEHQRFPDKLDALAPKYLASVPRDIYVNERLRYRPTETGFLLYSVGLDGKDDAGRGRGDPPPGDDLAIRLPLVEKK